MTDIDKIARNTAEKFFALEDKHKCAAILHRQIKAALQSVMPQWKPIDEKEKNGEMFLLLLEPDPVNTSNVCVGYFEERSECWFVKYGCGERVLPISYMTLP